MQHLLLKTRQLAGVLVFLKAECGRSADQAV